MKAITKHFSYEEFACRDGSPYPPQWMASRLVPLCQLLEAIREEFSGKPVTIMSGYRSLSYNRQIGGARASQHMEGRAADIKVKGISAAVVHSRILAMHDAGELELLGGLGQYPNFTHVDIRPHTRLARWQGWRAEN